MLRSRVMPIVLLTWTSIAAFSEECVAKLVYRVLLLYLVESAINVLANQLSGEISPTGELESMQKWSSIHKKAKS